MTAALDNAMVRDSATATLWSIGGYRVPLAAAPAAFETDDAVSWTVKPVRALRAAMAVRTQPTRANENFFGPVTAGAFLRTHQFLPRRDAMFRFNDRIHPFSPQRLDYRSNMLIHCSLH